jgi:hypothetical protein
VILPFLSLSSAESLMRIHLGLPIFNNWTLEALPTHTYGASTIHSLDNLVSHPEMHPTACMHSEE